MFILMYVNVDCFMSMVSNIFWYIKLIVLLKEFNKMIVNVYYV